MFKERKNCPVCSGIDDVSVYKCDYSSDPVSAYIYEYYQLDGKIGRQEYEDRFSNAVYEILSCSNCGLIYQKYVPGQDLLSAIYAKWIPSGMKSSGIPQHAHRHYISEAMRLTSFLLRVAKKDTPDQITALDYGMGKGGFALAMMGCGMNVYGFDFADDRQSKGQLRGIRVISDLEIAKMEFDFINTEQVFEHLPNPAKTFQRFATALRPGGVLKVSVPFSASMEKGDFELDWKAGRYSRHSVMPVAPLEHLQYFRRPSLKKLADENNLIQTNILKLEELNSIFDLGRPKKFFRSLGGIFLRDRIRNYFLFQKPF